jgi:hypothetical protein
VNIAHRRSSGSIASAVHGDAEMMCDWNMQEPAPRSQTLKVRSSETCTAKLTGAVPSAATPRNHQRAHRTVAQPTQGGLSCAILAPSQLRPRMASVPLFRLSVPLFLFPIVGAVIPIVGAVIPIIGAVIPIIGAVIPIIGAVIPIVGAVIPIVGAVIPMISILIPSITSASQLA